MPEDRSFTAITIRMPDDSEMLVRKWDDGIVEVDIRVEGNFGPRVWTPLAILGGSFTVQECQSRSYAS